MTSKWSNATALLVRVLCWPAFVWAMDIVMVVCALGFTLSTIYVADGLGTALYAGCVCAGGLSAAYSIGRRRCDEQWIKLLQRERDELARAVEATQTQQREALKQDMERLQVTTDDQKLLLSAPMDRSKDRWQ